MAALFVCPLLYCVSPTTAGIVVLPRSSSCTRARISKSIIRAMFDKRPSLTILLLLNTLLLLTSYVFAIPLQSNTTKSAILSIINSTILPPPLNFLGVECYHLKSATVNLQACQSLFANLFRAGHIYKKEKLNNGYRAMYAYQPVASPWHLRTGKTAKWKCLWRNWLRMQRRCCSLVRIFLRVERILLRVIGRSR